MKKAKLVEEIELAARRIAEQHRLLDEYNQIIRNGREENERLVGRVHEAERAHHDADARAIRLESALREAAGVETLIARSRAKIVRVWPRATPPVFTLNDGDNIEYEKIHPDQRSKIKVGAYIYEVSVYVDRPDGRHHCSWVEFVEGAP